MSISVKLSLSNWSFQQARRIVIPRLDWPIRQSTQDLVSISSTNPDQKKLPVKNTKQERKWSTAAGVLTGNTKAATIFSFSELHSNILINQSLHVVELNIGRYYMIIGCHLIRYLCIDIHGAGMNIHLYGAAITWLDIDSTTNDVYSIKQNNAPFKYETKIMKRILDAKYTKSDHKTIS